MTINNKSERNYQGKCLGWPVTSYGAGYMVTNAWDQLLSYTWGVKLIFIGIQTHCPCYYIVLEDLAYLGYG